MTKVGEHVRTADEDSMEQEKVVGAKAETETWKTGPCKGRLRIMKNLGIFDPKLFFFINASL